jgi:protein TonB
MSYASEQKRANPATMGMALLINGSIIAAVMLSPMVVGPHTETPVIKTYDVPDKKLPDPVDQPQTDEKIKSDPIYIPDPINDTPFDKKDGPTVTRDQPGTINDTGGGTAETGSGTGTLDPPVIKDPPPAPFVKATRDPRFADRFQPDYPVRMLNREIEGNAVIKVLIGADGRVREAQVVRATHPDFGEASVRHALKAWRFKPATRGGEPVEDWQTLTVHFTIK